MMDLEIIIISEVRQRKTNTYNITYMWNLKNNTDKLTYKTETDSQTQKIDLPEGKRRGINKKFGIANKKCKQQAFTDMISCNNL